MIDAKGLYFIDLNHKIKESPETNLEVRNVLGQRYIGTGVFGKTLTVYGTPGNALGAYLDRTDIIVNGNGQDATGDTMDNGRIIIHGNCGDTTGYAMRGGYIFIKGNAGYRVGIHMKEYKEHKPVIVVGGRTGDFLGEYQAGGIIVVLGIGVEGCPVGAFCGTGLHGGKIYIRSTIQPTDLPKQVICEKAEDVSEIKEYVEEYARLFGEDAGKLLASEFFVLRPNSKNPYKQMYTNV
ncbi:MAG: glutamate synthase [Bacillota bacterium]|nr:glutamate synthase [Bacillota bacterium]